MELGVSGSTNNTWTESGLNDSTSPTPLQIVFFLLHQPPDQNEKIIPPSPQDTTPLLTGHLLNTWQRAESYNLEFSNDPAELKKTHIPDSTLGAIVGTNSHLPPHNGLPHF